MAFYVRASRLRAENPSMHSKSKPSLALIGAGYWGKNLARNFLELGALHTLCDSRSDILEGYGPDYAGVHRSSRLEEVLADDGVRQVAIAVPAVHHFSVAKAALEAGKDVFVEKPLCLDAEEGEELVALAASRGRILMVGHLLQYHPCIEKLRELVSSGELGKLFYVTSNRLNLGKIRREENALWSFAPHDISVILSLTGGQAPEEVICTGESYLTRGVHDTSLTNLRFAGGTRAHIYVSWLNPFKEQKLTVIGSQALAVFDDTRPWDQKLTLYRQYLTWSDGQVPTPTKAAGEPVMVPETEPLRNECRHFLDCCESRQQPRTDGNEGIRVLRVLQAAQRSLDRHGEPIRGLDTPAGRERTRCFVHPTAVVDEGARIGTGSKIWHFSHVMKGAHVGEGCVVGQNVNIDGGTSIGNNVKIQNNVSIYSGVTIEDDAFLGPSCVLTNVSNPRSQVNRHSLYEKTLIRRGATVGANATIVPGVTVGRYAFIAAGSVVTRDVPDYGLVMGNPARPRGWMSRHGHPLGSPGPDGSLHCPESGLRYREESPGVLRCLDLPEESPLPDPMRTGAMPYRSWRSNGTGQ